jgi:hypothetical protein
MAVAAGGGDVEERQGVMPLLHAIGSPSREHHQCWLGRGVCEYCVTAAEQWK